MRPVGAAGAAIWTLLCPGSVAEIHMCNAKKYSEEVDVVRSTLPKGLMTD